MDFYTLWSSVPCPTVVPCIHGLPSFHCTVTGDHVGIKGIFLQVSISSFHWGCLFFSTVRLPSSLLHSMGSLLNLGSVALVGVLNRSVARLGNWELISIDLIYNKDRYQH